MLKFVFCFNNTHAIRILICRNTLLDNTEMISFLPGLINSFVAERHFCIQSLQKVGCRRENSSFNSTIIDCHCNWWNRRTHKEHTNFSIEIFHFHFFLSLSPSSSCTVFFCVCVRASICVSFSFHFESASWINSLLNFRQSFGLWFKTDYNNRKEAIHLHVKIYKNVIRFDK